MSSKPKPIGTLQDAPAELARRIVERATRIKRPVVAYHEDGDVFAVCADSLVALYMDDADLLIGLYTSMSDIDRVAEDIAETVSQIDPDDEKEAA
jgi:intracellular sulfur oxidation DsrE/DsrF family protein